MFADSHFLKVDAARFRTQPGHPGILRLRQERRTGRQFLIRAASRRRRGTLIDLKQEEHRSRMMD